MRSGTRRWRCSAYLEATKAQAENLCHAHVVGGGVSRVVSDVVRSQEEHKGW